MNIENALERMHAANAERRRAEREEKRRVKRPLWMPAAAAAAVALLVAVPMGRKSAAQPLPEAGIWCNSQCSPDEVMALLDENINHIRTIQAL